jgi:hypothetical protein
MAAVIDPPDGRAIVPRAGGRRAARTAPDRSGRPSGPLARIGEMLITAGRYLAPETEECLPGQ